MTIESANSTSDENRPKEANPPSPSLPRPKPQVSIADRLPPWLKWVLVIVPLLSFGIAAASFLVALTALRFNLGFTRLHEDHDVVGRVLDVRLFPKTMSKSGTNAELFVDLALINRGNQKEIIQDAFVCYAADTNFQARAAIRQYEPTPIQLDRGDKRLLQLHEVYHSLNTGKKMWLGVIVRAIAPNTDDTEVVWPVCEIDLAPDGHGGSISYNKEQTPQIQIISNQRQPHQKLSTGGW